MSDVMMFGIAKMPYEMAMGDEMSRRQFYANTQLLAAALEAAREDVERLDEIKRSRLAVTPVEGGGWDVTVFGADDYKETLLGSGADMRAAIDEAIDQARGKGVAS